MGLDRACKEQLVTTKTRRGAWVGGVTREVVSRVVCGEYVGGVQGKSHRGQHYSRKSVYVFAKGDLSEQGVTWTSVGGGGSSLRRMTVAGGMFGGWFVLRKVG